MAEDQGFARAPDSSIGQAHQAREGWLKSAGLVERFERWFVVDVQPLDSAPASSLSRLENQLAPNAAPLEIAVNGGVEQKGVNAAVPGEIDISGQPVSGKSEYKRQAARQDGLKIDSLVTGPGGGKKFV